MCHEKTSHVLWVMVHGWHAKPLLSVGKGGLSPRFLIDVHEPIHLLDAVE